MLQRTEEVYIKGAHLNSLSPIFSGRLSACANSSDGFVRFWSRFQRFVSFLFLHSAHWFVFVFAFSVFFVFAPAFSDLCFFLFLLSAFCFRLRNTYSVVVKGRSTIENQELLSTMSSRDYLEYALRYSCCYDARRFMEMNVDGDILSIYDCQGRLSNSYVGAYGRRWRAMSRSF